jgi:hypothetical protein
MYLFLCPPQYPSVHICSTHFTVGNGGKYDLKLAEASPGSLVCKLKHVKVQLFIALPVGTVVHCFTCTILLLPAC